MVTSWKLGQRSGKLSYAHQKGKYITIIEWQNSGSHGKRLGILVDSKLNFSSQCQAASPQPNRIKRCKYAQNLNIVLVLYKSHNTLQIIRVHIEHCIQF